jgi:ankyrin repeat protein
VKGFLDNPLAQDNDGLTALDNADAAGHTEIVKLLKGS